MSDERPDPARPQRREPTLPVVDRFERAERWMRPDPQERRWMVRGIVAALVLHAAVLLARMPDLSEPVRVDPPDQQMQVQFLKPPPPPPPPPPEEKPKPKPKPVEKKIPMPDPTPLEPEPVVEPPPEPPPPEPPPIEVPPQPPVQQLPPAPAGPVRVQPGQGPGLIKRVEPEYPRVLQLARTQGTVVLDAVIRKDGTVSEIEVLRSTHPLFTEAAVEAIKQWRYSPGPHDVVLTVTVNFTLRR